MLDLERERRRDQPGRAGSAATPGKATNSESMLPGPSSGQVDGSNGIYAPGSVFPTGRTPWDQAIGPAGAQGAQTDEQREAEHEQKGRLIRQAIGLGTFAFKRISSAADNAIDLLSVPEIPKTDLTKQLLGAGAAALLGAGAGAAAAAFFGEIAGAAVATKATSTASSLVSGAVRDALEKSQAKEAASLADIKQAFKDAFAVQLDLAELNYIRHWPQLEAGLALFTVDQLTAFNDVAISAMSTNPASIRTAMKRETFVAWTNFLARLKHGASGWDYWAAGGHGSPGAIATHDAQPKPNAGGLDHSNIKPSNFSPLLDGVQRPMADDPYGILEIFVMGSDPKSMRVVNEPGYRMRLDNVGPKVREEFRTMKRVGDLKVNKVVHLCSYHSPSGFDVDPPTSVASVMITADGYIRAQNGWDARYAPIATFANAVQELPLSWLEV